MIYGHENVTVEKEPQFLRWAILDADTSVIIMYVSWHLKYDMPKAPDRRKKASRNETEGQQTSRLALEICLIYDDLNPREIQMLEEKMPGSTKKPAYKVDRAKVSWDASEEAESDDSAESTIPEGGKRRLWI